MKLINILMLFVLLTSCLFLAGCKNTAKQAEYIPPTDNGYDYSNIYLSGTEEEKTRARIPIYDIQQCKNMSGEIIAFTFKGDEYRYTCRNKGMRMIGHIMGNEEGGVCCVK